MRKVGLFCIKLIDRIFRFAAGSRACYALSIGFLLGGVPVALVRKYTASNQYTAYIFAAAFIVSYITLWLISIWLEEKEKTKKEHDKAYRSWRFQDFGSPLVWSRHPRQHLDIPSSSVSSSSESSGTSGICTCPQCLESENYVDQIEAIEAQEQEEEEMPIIRPSKGKRAIIMRWRERE